MLVDGYWFDYASALCAAVSAFFWAWSAKIKIPTGYDVGLEQKEPDALMTVIIKQSAAA